MLSKVFTPAPPVIQENSATASIVVRGGEMTMLPVSPGTVSNYCSLNKSHTNAFQSKVPSSIANRLRNYSDLKRSTDTQT